MLPLTKKKLTSYQDSMEGYICRKTIIKSLQKIKITEKLEIIAIMLVEIEVLHVVFVF